MSAPKIRFAGFDEAWELRKFSEFAARESTVRMSSPDCPSIEYEDVVAEEGRLNKDIHRKETQKTGIVFDGTQVLYGKLRPYLHNWLSPDFQGVAVGDWWVLRPLDINKGFLFRLFQTRRFDEVANQSSGSKMPRADWNLVSNTEFTIPVSLDEQRLIAKTFDDLDTLITLHQHKYDQLAALKKSLLQRMFPKPGKTVPELRFAGFTGDWEEYTCGDLYMERSEKGDDSLPILSVSIHDGISDGELDEENLGKIVRRSEDKSKYKKVYPGDLIFNMMRAWQGAIGVTKSLGMVSPAYITAIPDDKLVPLFMDTCMRRPDIIGQINNLSYGVTDFRKRLYWDSFVKVRVLIPSKEEQERIISLFANLDNAINNCQRHLNTLQTLKQSLLQKMFV